MKQLINHSETNYFKTNVLFPVWYTEEFPFFSFLFQLNSDSAIDETISDHAGLSLQSQDSTSSVGTEEVLQIRTETPSLEASLDNSSNQLPEVGRNVGWCMADLGSF